MRRLFLIATSMLLALVPAWGQMRAAPRFARIGRPGFAAHTSVFFNGGLAFGHNRRFHVFSRPNRFLFHRRFFVAGGFFYPFWYGYPYYPAYSYPIVTETYPSYDAAAAYDQQREMAREIDRLSGEVERLREEQERSQAAPPQAQPSPQAHTGTEPQRSTVLVFRDKRTQEVQNYAIIGQTLWVFSEQRAKRVPLAELDVPATTKLNEERGVEFRVSQHANSHRCY